MLQFFNICFVCVMQNGKFGVDALARQAVRFLHLCFESDHPRVRGQTVSEVSSKIFHGC